MTVKSTGGFYRKSVLDVMVYGLAFTIPISQFVSMRLLLVTLVYAFFSGRISKMFTNLLGSFEIGIYLLVLGVGVLYSEDIRLGVGILETNVSMLVMPLVFGALGRLSERHLQFMLGSFVAGLFAACSICLVAATVSYMDTNDLGSFFFYRLSGTLDMQPTYMAYYLIFAICVCLYLTYYSETKVPVGVMILVVFFFFVVLMLTGGRTAFIGLLLIFAFIILKYLVEPRAPIKSMVVACVLVMLVVVFTVHSSGSSYWAGAGDYWERSELWRSGIEANPSPLVGVGTGDHQLALNAYYRTHGNPAFAEESLNAHNQYVQIYLSNGLLGLGALFLLLGRPLYRSFRNQSTMSTLVFFPFVIYGVTEVFLGRYQGIVFFVFLHQLFVNRNEGKLQPEEI